MADSTGSSHHPLYEEAVGTPLNESRFTKEIARSVVEDYVLGTESKMDGSLHPDRVYELTSIARSYQKDLSVAPPKKKPAKK
jgi:hypothetical protein